MAEKPGKPNPEVTSFLDKLKHPFRDEIEALRKIILEAVPSLREDVKWNGPNYAVEAEDRITMKIHPPKQIQLIFHRGAKVKEQPKTKLIDDNSKTLVWKGNDRAVASYASMKDIEAGKSALKHIVSSWIKATASA